MLQTVLQDHNPWWRDATSRRARDRRWRRDYQRRLMTAVQRQNDRRAILLCGPRQVGKTVGLLQVADDLLDLGLEPNCLLYFDFSDDRLTAPVTPREVLAAAPQITGTRYLLLDELTSCAGDWDVWLKQAVDAEGMRIVATDSSASLLRAGGRESGLGRWDEWHIETMTFREWCGFHAPRLQPAQALQADPALLARYLRIGGFPEHALQVEDPDLVRRRLRSDLMDKAVRRDLARFDLSRDLARLFAYVMESSGDEFKASERGRDLDLDRRTVDKGIDVFMDAGLVRSVERWTTKPAARLRAPVKLHAVDHGMVLAFAPVPEPWHDARTLARVFEAVVFRHIREVVGTGVPLGYFRDDANGLEADFIVRQGEAPVVVEVTSSREPDNAKVRSTVEVQRRLQAKRAVIIHGGVAAGAQQGVRLVPLHEFLLAPEMAIGEAL